MKGFEKYKLTSKQTECLDKLRAALEEAENEGIVFFALPNTGTILALNDSDNTTFISTNRQADRDCEIPYVCTETVGYINVLPDDGTVCGILE